MSLGRLRDLAISDSGFIFDPYTGASYSTNATGLAIIEALKRGGSRGEVLAALAERFEVDGAPLERDVDDFLTLMRRHELLSPEAS